MSLPSANSPPPANAAPELPDAATLGGNAAANLSPAAHAAREARIAWWR
jgi:hypothetical protein